MDGEKKAAIEDLLKRLEQGLVPDEELKKLIRIQLGKRLQWGYKPTYQDQIAEIVKLAKSLRQMSIGTETDKLDAQLYQVPIPFLKLMSGKTIKESCCYFRDNTTTLDEAEIAMLDLYCERAQIKDGQKVLDLGCGQGAVSLHVAQKYKNCHVTAITNSVSQRNFIEENCKTLQLSNVKVILSDIVVHEMNDTFDRILAISVFEHMKNYELLLRKISKWMAADGLIFVEHLCHKAFAYNYEPIDEDDWYTDYFFPSGTFIMPSASLLLYFQDDVSVAEHWILNGKHFARTMEEWLKGLDANIDKAKEILGHSFSGNMESAEKVINYWRAFCIDGSEFGAYNDGEEWMVSHVLFKKK